MISKKLLCNFIEDTHAAVQFQSLMQTIFILEQHFQHIHFLCTMCLTDIYVSEVLLFQLLQLRIFSNLLYFFRLQDNCPGGKLPPNPKTNPNLDPNPNPSQGAVLSGGAIFRIPVFQSINCSKDISQFGSMVHPKFQACIF